MAEEVTLKLTVDAVGAAQSVKDLKQVIRDATNEALKFKEGSAEFAKFANIAAQAKDKLGDVRQQMAALDPDQKAQSFLKLGNAIVGGFTAAQGAAALFGASTEDVQKALLKVQSAMALLQGFKAIEEGVQAFTVMRGAIMTVIASLGAMKAAMITTGIGALVVGLGLLISALNKLDEATKLSTDEITDHEVEVGKLRIEYEKITGQITEFEARLKELGLTHEQVMNKIAIEAEAKLNTANTWYNRAISQALFLLRLGDSTAGKQKQIQREADEAAIKELELYNQRVSNEFLASEFKKEEAAKKAREDAAKAKRDHDRSEITYLKEQNEIGLLELSKIEQKALDRSNAAVKKSFTQKTLDLRFSQSEQLKFMLSDASVRTQIEGSVFSAIAAIGNSTIKNQEKLAAFNKKIAAVQIIVSQAEALAKAVAGAQSVPFPGNLVAIASVVASIASIFAGIKALFAKAGDVGGAPSLDTGTNFSGASASISDNTPSGVNFLDQPQTGLGGGTGGNTPPPPPIVIKNVISEHEITSVQDRVSNITRQATID